MKTIHLGALCMLLGVATAIQSRANTTYVWTPASGDTSGLGATIVLDSDSNSDGNMFDDVVSAVFTSPVGTYDLSNAGTRWYSWNKNYGVIYNLSGVDAENDVAGFSNLSPFSWDPTQIDNANLEWNLDPGHGMIEIQFTASGSGVIWFQPDGQNDYSSGGQFLAAGSVGSVPDTASTCFLLGLGLAGLALASRKLVAAVA